MVFGAQLSKEVAVYFWGNFAYIFDMYKNLEKLLSPSWKWKVRLDFSFNNHVDEHCDVSQFPSHEKERSGPQRHMQRL